MKVLQIVTAYPRSPDDLITPWLVETLKRLRGHGIEAEVLAPAYRGLGDQEVDGIRVHRFRYAPRRWEDLTHDQTAPDRVADRPAYLGLLPGYVAAGCRAAARLARTGEYDVQHVHWPVPHALFGMAGRAAGGVPLVCSFYSVELTWVRRKMPWLRPFLRHVIRTSDAVTAISSSTEAMVRELYDRPVARIPFGATVAPETPGAPSPPAATSRERKSLTTATPVRSAMVAAQPSWSVAPRRPPTGDSCQMVWPCEPIRSTSSGATPASWQSWRGRVC